MPHCFSGCDYRHPWHLLASMAVSTRFGVFYQPCQFLPSLVVSATFGFTNHLRLAVREEAIYSEQRFNNTVRG